tara:strand:+ start:99 stop:2777 length:2679 start_codon:yes stop_codon:yes gene_type:complete
MSSIFHKIFFQLLIFIISLPSFSQCSITVTPDLPLTASSSAINSDITTIFNRFSTDYLGSSIPSLTNADIIYNGLNIGLPGELSISNWNIQNWSFLKTYVQYLRNAPSGTSTYTTVENNVNNTIQWASDQFCAGTLAIGTGYSYDDFGRAASLAIPNLTQATKDKFEYTLYVQTDDFGPLFVANYDETYQTNNEAINTDIMYTIANGILAYCLISQNTADERYRYMRSFKRYMERFFSYTNATSDGLKPDGSGFSHWTAYNNYMYAYKEASNILKYLEGTAFQVDSNSYMVFRDAVYAQYMQANDNNLQALSTSGRNPQNRTRPFDTAELRDLAIVGGNILGLTTADPILAGLSNRIDGIHAGFNYSTIAPFEEGFFQFNHATAAVYRKNNWLAFNKGFTDNMWGSEIYTSSNRYGRYQSYGALEIIYPGDKKTGNGFEVNSWNWNYNPGTTVIRLSYSDLEAEANRVDEMQQKKFSGALTFRKKNTGVLNEGYGTYGMFAMDFQEQEGLGWGGTISPTTHNNTFTFKKSSFYLDSLIVCLGSGISNTDLNNNTITTLYQRIDNNNLVSLNASNQTTINTSGTNNRIVSNYNTGYYIVSNNTIIGTHIVNQQTPNQNQVDPTILTGTGDDYYIGYLDHGTNPSNAEYEYIIKPSTTVAAIEALHTDVIGGNKPYTIHQKDVNAHILEYPSKLIWGYAFFNATTSLNYTNSHVKAVDASCLIMTEHNVGNQTILLSVANPDIGVSSPRSYIPLVSTTRTITLHGKWVLNNGPYAGVNILSSTPTETIIEFTLKNGLAKETSLINPSTLGVIENNFGNNLLLYPNPTNGNFSIDLGKKYKTVTINIVDINGKSIQFKKFNESQLLNLKLEEPAGVYLLRIESEEKKAVIKLVKK